MSFYVVSVKDRIQKRNTRNIMYCTAKRSLMRLRRLERQILKRIWFYLQNYDFMQSLYAGERSARYATAEATKDIVISV
jgi:hypothetical protein